MIEYLKLFAAWINSPKTMSVFGAVAAIPLFLPACWLDALHVYSAVDHYRPFLWLVFLVCGCGLIFDGGRALVDREKIKKRLSHLTTDEQEFLSHFVLDWISTRQVMAFQAGAAGSLEMDGILFTTPKIGDAVVDKGLLYYTIKPWVLRYLDKNRRLLGDYQIRRK